jgi:hypothetical protein
MGKIPQTQRTILSQDGWDHSSQPGIEDLTKHLIRILNCFETETNQ